MRMITAVDVKKLLQEMSLSVFFQQGISHLKTDLNHWQDFDKSPRHAIYNPLGVIELMPTANDKRYSMKYVNGHPGNPKQQLQSVIALGLLSDVKSGYPILFCDMTLLTAIRTAIVTAVAAQYLAKKNTHTLSILGCGAQSEFQVLATLEVLDIQHIHCYDPDTAAMHKFKQNLQSSGITVTEHESVDTTVANADMIITATAKQGHISLLHEKNVPSGCHIHALGGDSPGKTEIAPALLKHCDIVVEYTPQTRHEGEIQAQDDIAIYAELWQLVQGEKVGRQHEDQLTLMDAVGFALEDYSILVLLESLLDQYQIGTEIDMLPTLSNPKDLYGFLQD